MAKLSIRRLTSYPEFEKCVTIERAVWRLEDIDQTPAHQFRISVEIGGIVLGAFLGKEMVGFVYSFPAFFGKKLCQHSHQLAVLPKYRGSGVGKKLKLAQRHWALKEGYDLLTWTFDPLQARNANLNLHTLGAVTKTYLPNFYEAASLLSLAPGVPTDRFLTEWHIKNKKVRRRKKKYDAYLLDRMPRILERKFSKDSNSYPTRPLLRSREKFVLVEIPQDINALCQEAALILKWQRAVKQVMTHYFRRGYWCIDFIYGERSFYVLERKAKSGLSKK